MSETDTSKIRVGFHPLFQECEVDGEELAYCLKLFRAGDAGDFSDEDEVLGFLARDLKDEFRHGVYETATAGRIHITGTRNEMLVLPDIIFASSISDGECSVNLCQCGKEEEPTPTTTN
jgi:hypothetical protein